MMREAKAGLDIKGDSFNQANKPPTKVHQYILSGLPPAVNANCNSYTYVQSQGLNICTPDETERWLSEDYWNEVDQFAQTLQQTTTLEAVGKAYRYVLESVL